MPKAAIPDSDWVRYTAELGHSLHRLRIAKGLSQEEVAYRAGISRHTYYRLEKGLAGRGAPANPGLRTIVAISALLDVEPHELLPTWTPDIEP